MNKEICDEEFNKYFKEETNKQTFKIKMEEPMKLIINYDYYFLLLKKLERLESKIKMLEKYKDDYNGQLMLIQVYEKEIDRLNNILDGLKKWLEEETRLSDEIPDTLEHSDYTDVLDKLKALKEE